MRNIWVWYGKWRVYLGRWCVTDNYSQSMSSCDTCFPLIIGKICTPRHQSSINGKYIVPLDPTVSTMLIKYFCMHWCWMPSQWDSQWWNDVDGNASDIFGNVQGYWWWSSSHAWHNRCYHGKPPLRMDQTLMHIESFDLYWWPYDLWSNNKFLQLLLKSCLCMLISPHNEDRCHSKMWTDTSKLLLPGPEARVLYMIYIMW